MLIVVSDNLCGKVSVLCFGFADCYQAILQNGVFCLKRCNKVDFPKNKFAIEEGLLVNTKTQ